MDILSNPDLSDLEKRQLIAGYADRLIDEKNYDEAAGLLSNLMYSGDPKIEQRIMDEAMRLYYIYANALATELKLEPEPLPLLALRKDNEYRDAIIETKLALRRIWFGVPGGKEGLLSAVESHNFGAALIITVCQCSVPEVFISSVIKKAADFIGEVRPADREILLAFADALGGQGDVQPPRSRWDSVRVIEIDASKGPAGSLPEGGADDKAIAFIACANDPRYVSEITEYVSTLDYPEGFRVEVIFVWNSPSMAAGYNLAMRSSGARYKIYIHQDSFITDRDFIVRLIRFFDENEYDMLGIAGGAIVPESGQWTHIDPSEGHMCLMHDYCYVVAGDMVNPVGKATLKTLDGIFMATRVDVPWREDIFTGFHFYDISQCMEFTRRGLKIGYFDNGGQLGFLHEVSFNFSDEYDKNYEAERMKFLGEYGQEISCT